ncbi:MAG TPA: pyruvate kinase [Candidatus Absconditabacterales bacterium]|nr:pyruvate kinase [Candidatus Absconditabacterales bacterium]HOQ78608.1 pyruvate kinase [Candidatus Absconditabacterales bacterium]HPK28268.1 pyruvate kinase [Candidatus Absconditabacterales bacterium]
MANFNFSKIIAGVGPVLAKETVLSKVINMVDVFRLSLSGGFDDNNKKYIETIMKLDNSKTIMMETKGCDIRVKNLVDIKLKKGATINIDYSEYAQEGDKQVFIDYQKLGELGVGAKIRFEQSDILVEVSEIVADDNINCKVLEGGTLLQFDRVRFLNNPIDFGVLTERDKKDILRGLEYGIHMIALSGVKSPDDILELKSFLSEQNKGNMKIVAKIETLEGLKNLDAINAISDSIIFVFDKITEEMKALKLTKEGLIKKIQSTGKPVAVSFISSVGNKDYPFRTKEGIKEFCDLSIDSFVLEHIIEEEETLPIITETYELLEKCESEVKDVEAKRFDNDEDFAVRDYIIYSAYRITRELDIKAIVCFTDNGYSSARLSSLAPKVPVITFTKSDETYRFLNMIRGVRGYKISESFNYENLKRIGKEMIRIIFKGNISLDDKIVIVQSNEYQKDERSDMINGVELYKFKNI